MEQKIKQLRLQVAKEHAEKKQLKLELDQLNKKHEILKLATSILIIIIIRFCFKH